VTLAQSRPLLLGATCGFHHLTQLGSEVAGATFTSVVHVQPMNDRSERSSGHLGAKLCHFACHLAALSLRTNVVRANVAPR
jgi:hypothetical protein